MMILTICCRILLEQLIDLKFLTKNYSFFLTFNNLDSLKIVAILFLNTRKPLKLYCFESVQKLVSFLVGIYSFSVVLNIIFGADTDVVLNLSLNFEQKWASCSYKIVLV